MQNTEEYTRIINELNILRAQNEELHARLAARERTVPTVAPTPFRIKIEKPKLYTGERDALKIENWMYSVREYVGAYGLTGHEALRVAVSFTDGHAKLFWRNKERDLLIQEKPLDLEIFLTLISSQFYPNDYVQQLRNRLERLKQVKSVAEYSRNFEGILLQIPRHMWHEDDMKDKFIRGLKPEVRKMVLINDPPTLSESIKMANRVDAIIFSTNTVTRYNHNGESKEKGNDSMDVDSVTMKDQKIKCYNCNEFGHISRNCTKSPTEQTLAVRERSGKGPQQQ